MDVRMLSMMAVGPRRMAGYGVDAKCCCRALMGGCPVEQSHGEEDTSATDGHDSESIAEEIDE